MGRQNLAWLQANQVIKGRRKRLCHLSADEVVTKILGASSLDADFSDYIHTITYGRRGMAGYSGP